ncbi:putative fad dependent oxidoreductase [Moniliophthora roreri MCA 2997]|uniref:Fad dependent oxidoreductase n=1 Tax=Moniliophthora roreri (strain MCA 2997) TaxID=1381753 RepID=V2WKY1_MONRO|nr:putative fad dependent oxidoreductase [Moniliophthora roreri MCA 2997]
MQCVTSCTSVVSFFPGFDKYPEDNEHYYESSSEASTCTVQLESAADVGIIILQLYLQLQTVASGSTQSSFGIKRVQISLSRFNDVVHDTASSTIKIGAGLTCDQVYALLESFGVKVLGGRVPGVGVGGVLLGGGFSYFTDQYGLGVDNIISHDLVPPDGTFVHGLGVSTPPPERFVCPTFPEIHWDNAADDAYFIIALEETQQAIQAVAIAEGQSLADGILYNNYAPADTPLELLYGDKLERLREVEKRVDPGNIRVMVLTGGFKF